MHKPEIEITIRPIANGYTVRRRIECDNRYLWSDEHFFDSLDGARTHADGLISTAEADAADIETRGEPDF